MTSPEPSPLPADPVRYRRKGLSAWFWLVIVFGLLCIGLGIVIANYGPSLWPKQKAAANASPVLPWRASTADPAPVAVPAPAAAIGAAEPVPAGDVSSLSTRVAELESDQARTLQAASSALAAATLIQAAQTSRPFAAELSTVEALLPAADVTQLKRLAENGAPTRSALAAEFPVAASHAIAASRTVDSKSSLLQRARHAIGSIVTIRRVDYAEGSSAHAILARAELKLNEGDVEGALLDLDGLSPQARDALGPWRVGAERRAEIDRRLASIREAALRALQEAGSRPA